MFLIKKILGALLLPHAIFLVLLVTGVLMLWFSAKRVVSKVLVTFAAMGFFFLSYPVTWDAAIERMENRYPPLDIRHTDLSGVRWVVVFGGGGRVDEHLPSTSQMSLISQARLVEGIRIWNTIPQAKFLVSGDTDALILQDSARILGVNPQQIVVDSISRDTEQQALEIKKIVGSDRMVLVTSALHMTRSMALFAKKGMTPIPAPTDFFIKGPQPITEIILPSSTGGTKAASLLHECLGILWAKLRHRI
jgi:uncharacterized SAM-binding protein YcdF (DUF218 family)